MLSDVARVITSDAQRHPMPMLTIYWVRQWEHLRRSYHRNLLQVENLERSKTL